MLLSRISRISLLLASLLGGCQPTCEDVCTKIVACDNAGTERMPADECKLSCLDQKSLYAGWTDTVLEASFDDELSCLDASSCDEIAAGTCYDEDLWSF